MTKTAIARYVIGTITTKDANLWTRTKALQQEGETIESIFKKGLETIEQSYIDKLSQNNIS